MESDALTGAHMDEKDGVVAIVAYGLRVRVDEPGLLDGVGDDEYHFAVGDVGELEGLLDDGNVPTEELVAVNALFVMLAGVLALDVADGAVAIGFQALTGTGVERIGEDAAVLIYVAADWGVDGVSAVVGRAGGVSGLLRGDRRQRAQE
jgi:hypothetical protein